MRAQAADMGVRRFYSADRLADPPSPGRDERESISGTGNALVEHDHEATVIHRAYGLRIPGTMIALGMLASSGLSSPCPCRRRHPRQPRRPTSSDAAPCS
jgi:hypothetical protein